MKSIWVVRGESGEYEDHREWTVEAYSSKVEAKKHLAALEVARKRIGHEYDCWLDDPDKEDSFHFINPYDPRQDDVLTTYCMYRLPVRARFARKQTRKNPVL